MLILYLARDDETASRIETIARDHGCDALRAQSGEALCHSADRRGGPEAIVVQVDERDCRTAQLCRQLLSHKGQDRHQVILLAPQEHWTSDCDIPPVVLVRTLDTLGEELSRLSSPSTLLSELAATQELRFNSEEELTAIFLHAPIPIFLVDGEGKVIRTNRAPVALRSAHGKRSGTLGHILGCVYSLSETGGCGRIIDGKDNCTSCEIRNIIKHTLHSGGCHHRKEAEVAMSGEPEDHIHVLLSSIPVWINGQKRVLVYLEDVTELRSSQNALEQINRALEQKVEDRTIQVRSLLAQKQAFVNQLGHDLRTPLTPIVGLLPLIREGVCEDRMREMVDLLIRNAEYMQLLVDRTLDLIRLDSCATTIEPKLLDLRTETRNMVGDLSPLLERRDIGVENRIVQPMPVHADPLQLKELYFNLLGNAMKFVRAGGTITLGACREEQWVVAWVRDTGIGVEPEHLESIFGEFYKVDPSRHDRRSPGLGLSICQRIVTNHGGRIWAHSEGPGKGTTIYFTLPPAGVLDTSPLAVLDTEPHVASQPEHPATQETLL